MEKNIPKSIQIRTKNIRKYYRVIAEVGSGTYGRVYKAECLKTKQYVALKKFESKDEKIKEDGFPITAIREIKLLKQLDHPNIIKLREIIASKPSERNDFRGSTFLVFDYMDHDFADLKIANILYNNQGEVKIADFGLARLLNPLQPKYTNKVVTLWYRAPELLLGAREYTSQIDIWSVGCVFIELLVNENLLKGENESRQIEKIYELCGSPDIKSWPEVTKLQFWKDLKPRRQYEKRLREELGNKKKDLDAGLINLIDEIMVINPLKRLTIDQCLNHNFFKCDPLPLEIHQMPKIKEECHEALLKNSKNRHQILMSQKNQFTKRISQSPDRVPPNKINNANNGSGYIGGFPFEKQQKQPTKTQQFNLNNNNLPFIRQNSGNNINVVELNNNNTSSNNININANNNSNSTNKQFGQLTKQNSIKKHVVFTQSQFESNEGQEYEKNEKHQDSEKGNYNNYKSSQQQSGLASLIQKKNQLDKDDSSQTDSSSNNSNSKNSDIEEQDDDYYNLNDEHMTAKQLYERNSTQYINQKRSPIQNIDLRIQKKHTKFE